MDLWGSVFAACYDRCMTGIEQGGLARHRATLLSSAAGRVLEIGAGTGANLPFYGSGVSELVACEPDGSMAGRLERKLAGYRVRTRAIRSPAEALPFSDASFDHVVSTLVLCTVSDAERALAEARRVLKPGGRLLFIEHVRSEDPKLARWQDRLRAPWAWLGHGCQCNRALVPMIGACGLSVTELRHEKMPKAPPIVRPLVVGTAARLRS